MNRIDVSKAIDLLLHGAVPERSAELAALWGTGEDRVHLAEGKFVIGEFFGVIQVTEITLRQIWLLSFAAERAIEAYAGVFWLLTWRGLPFDRDEVAAWHGQAEADAAFDAMLIAARNLRDGDHLDTLQWPDDVPEPTFDNRFDNLKNSAAFDLACVAGAYIFLHEIQHVRFGKEGNRPSDPNAEELECDRFARRFLLEKIDDYVQESGEAAEMVRAKRALGIAVAKMIILEVTPPTLWKGSDIHPAVKVRVKSFLGDPELSAPMTESFWIGVASFLAAMCRSCGRLPDEIAFSSARELALSLTDCL